MSILVITTGGTIGALPYENPQAPPEMASMPGHDLVAEALQTTFASFETRCLSFPPRDSKLIDQDYRQAMLAEISAAPESALLVTHGTDTLLTSADFFYRAFADEPALAGKSLILTGAMMPLANGAESDGYQNMTFALNLLAQFAATLPQVSIVLSDFDQDRQWKPRLFPHAPDRYEKFYDADGRYHRIRKIG